MKLTVLRAKVVAGTDAQNLEDNLNAWLRSTTEHKPEARFVGVFELGDLSVLVLYTD